MIKKQIFRNEKSAPRTQTKVQKPIAKKARNLQKSTKRDKIRCQ